MVTMLERLQTLDTAVLENVVRQDKRNPSFEITDWAVGRLSDKGIINPDGLLLFSGHGHIGQAVMPWSVALKVLQIQDQEQDPRHMNYWKRELLAFESGLLTHLPGSLVAPRYYGSIELGESIGMWMEHILDTAPSSWAFDQYAFAARQLGQLNGAYMSGTPLPDYPWLATGHCRTWSGAPQETLENAWENPIIRQTFSEKIHERCRRLWAEREKFYTVLDRLPQVFSHFDFQRRNLFIRKGKNNRDEVVAVDWALCGIGALGGDLHSIIGGSLMLGAVDLATAPSALDRLAFEAYLSGLREMGWKGNPDLVRLGYTTWIALWLGAFGPLGASYWTSATPWWTEEQANAFALQQFGKMGKELVSGWAVLCEFALDRADEARRLADRYWAEL